MSTVLTAISVFCVPPVASAGDRIENGSMGDGRPPDFEPSLSIATTAEFRSQSWVGCRGLCRQSVYAYVEPEITLRLNQELSVFAHLVMEPVDDPAAGRFTWFRDEGVYAEELYGTFSREAVSFKAGKFDPVFGLAADKAPGLFGGDLAKRYDVAGVMGFATTVTLSSDEVGNDDHDDEKALERVRALEVAAFTSDRSVLGHSLLTDGGGLSLSDSMAGNTASVASFSIAYRDSTLDEDDNIAGPVTQLAVRQLASGARAGEWDFLMAAATALDLDNGLVLKPMAEVALLTHRVGEPKDAAEGTIAMEMARGAWSVSFAAAINQGIGPAAAADSMLAADVGRIFESPQWGKFRVDIGFREARIDGQTTGILAMRLQKGLTWSW